MAGAICNRPASRISTAISAGAVTPAKLHFNVLAANSVLNGPGTSPVELLAADPAAQFTGPNQISNRFMQVSLSGNLEVSDTVSIQAVTYYNNFLQRVANGNAPNDTPCNDGSGLLCSDSGYSTTLGGATIPAFLGANPLAYSELDNQTTNTNGYGVSIQATETQTLFGFANHLVGGVSFDGAQTEFTAASIIGGITPDTRVFIGPGVIIDEPGNNQPVRVAIGDAYYGAFIADTFNVTDRLALTASGRFNAAAIDLNDQNGGDLTGNHAYERFNPAAGVTYKVTPWLTAYAGYAEANRAPTPAELSCAGPARFLQPGQFLRRRSQPEAGGLAHHRGRLARRAGIGRRRSAELRSRPLSQRPRRRHRLRQQRDVEPGLLRQCRADAPAGDRRRHPIQGAALVGLSRLYLHRRDLSKRLRGGGRQQSGRRCQWQHHDQSGRPVARRAGASGQARRDLARHRPMDDRCRR